MLRSLRFRLPALFLAGIVVSGLIAAALAFRLLQTYALDRAREDLRGESSAITRLYQRQTEETNDVFPISQFERATGAWLYYIPAQPALASVFDLPASRKLRPDVVDLRRVAVGEPAEFEFVPPGQEQRFSAIARPLALGPERNFVGALVVAKPKEELEEQVGPLLQRLALALILGVIAASALAWYFSRRITRPILALSAATDQVAAGRYDVELPPVRGGDEIAHLTTRFREMTVRLTEAELQERNFLMSVSHELRTPLTAIRGHVEALREGVAEDPAQRTASLDVIAAEAARLERLVGDILDLAKLEANRFAVRREEVDMDSLCERAYTAFGEEARRRGIDYRREATAHPVIVTDGDRVLQIITNLLSNAFRWTPDDGRIELDLSAENGTIAVAVGDTGPGISEDERERIFRPFFSRDGAGTGLGLAIANELAAALGGSIRVDTVPGRGSRFELLLPAGTAS